METNGKRISRRYLGDAVYADFDGYNVVLICEAPSQENTIFLEPAVVLNLRKYCKEIEKAYKISLWPEE